MDALVSTTLVIGGDLCPVGRIGPVLERGDGGAAFGSLLPDLQSADLFMANLECPLVDRATPAIKGGPVLGFSPRCLAGLKQANLSLLGLANNHIMDHGHQGLTGTIEACRMAGIDTVGAGGDLAEAGRLWMRNVGDHRLGVLALSEAEYSLAGPHRPGANSMDVIRTAKMLRAARTACDFLVVLVHGGNEHLDIPRPGLRDFCRWLVEEGARVVVCQHSHCVGTYESYASGLIVYGQGNLLFDYPSQQAMWRYGVLIKLCLDSGGGFTHEFVPYSLRPAGTGIERLPAMEAEAFLSGFRARSLVLADEEAYERQWRQFCESRRSRYMSLIHGFCRPLYLLNRTGLLTRLLFTRTQLRNIGNVIRCESHRDVLTTLADVDLERERGSRI